MRQGLERYVRDQVCDLLCSRVGDYTARGDLICGKLNALLLGTAGLSGDEAAIFKAFHMFAQHFGKYKIPIDADLRRQVFAIMVKNGSLDEVTRAFSTVPRREDNTRSTMKSSPSVPAQSRYQRDVTALLLSDIDRSRSSY